MVQSMVLVAFDLLSAAARSGGLQGGKLSSVHVFAVYLSLMFKFVSVGFVAAQQQSIIYYKYK